MLSANKLKIKHVPMIYKLVHKKPQLKSLPMIKYNIKPFKIQTKRPRYIYTLKYNKPLSIVPDENITLYEVMECMCFMILVFGLVVYLSTIIYALLTSGETVKILMGVLVNIYLFLIKYYNLINYKNVIN